MVRFEIVFIDSEHRVSLGESWRRVAPRLQQVWTYRILLERVAVSRQLSKRFRRRPGPPNALVWNLLGEGAAPTLGLAAVRPPRVVQGRVSPGRAARRHFTVEAGIIQRIGRTRITCPSPPVCDWFHHFTVKAGIIQRIGRTRITCPSSPVCDGFHHRRT